MDLSYLWNVLERTSIEGDSPVHEYDDCLDLIQSTTGHVTSGGKQGGPSSKAKYLLVTDSV